MKDINSLRLNNRFKRAYDKGCHAVLPTIVLYAVQVRQRGGFGITVSKKIGKAVVRNRCKRRIRGLYRKYKSCFYENYDIVAVARTRTAEADAKKLEADFLKAANKLGIVKECGNLTEK